MLADAVAAGALYLTAAILGVIAAAMGSIGQRAHREHPAAATVLLAGAGMVTVLCVVALTEGVRR